MGGSTIRHIAALQYFNLKHRMLIKGNNPNNRILQSDRILYNYSSETSTTALAIAVGDITSTTDLSLARSPRLGVPHYKRPQFMRSWNKWGSQWALKRFRIFQGPTRTACSNLSRRVCFHFHHLRESPGKEDGGDWKARASLSKYWRPHTHSWK